MSDQSRKHERREGERHAAREQTPHDAQVTSHRDAVRRVREARRFALQLPVIGRVPIPRPDQLAFYSALGALVGAELLDWPIALAIGAGHALVSQQRPPEKSWPGPPEP
jgi:hypothetical protein